MLEEPEQKQGPAMDPINPFHEPEIAYQNEGDIPVQGHHQSTLRRPPPVVEEGTPGCNLRKPHVPKPKETQLEEAM